MVDSQIICKPYFDKERFTLILGIDSSAVCLDSISEFVRDNEFSPKDEFHITVLGVRAGKRIQRALMLAMNSRDGEDKRMQKEIEKLIDEINWQDGLELLPEYYHLHKDYPLEDGSVEHRESCIQIASLPSAKKFINEIQKICGFEMENIFPHITLFVKGDGPGAPLGIGIISRSEFESLHPSSI